MISMGHQVKSYGQKKKKTWPGWVSIPREHCWQAYELLYEPDDHLALSGCAEHLALIKRNSRFRIAIVAVKTGLIRKK